MTSASDDPGTGAGEEPVAQTGRPPVPGRAPADGKRAGGGEHRTERVPFPLPAPDQAPQTGRLRLGGYPPQVPDAARRSEPGAAGEPTGAAAGDDDPRKRR